LFSCIWEGFTGEYVVFRAVTPKAGDPLGLGEGWDWSSLTDLVTVIRLHAMRRVKIVGSFSVTGLLFDDDFVVSVLEIESELEFRPERCHICILYRIHKNVRRDLTPGALS